MPRQPKKSETVEIRLSHASKSDFMARCEAKGLTASEAIRRFIDSELAGRSVKRRLQWKSLVTAALIGLGLGAIAAPSLAQGKATSRAAFEQLDTNRDGVVTYVEFARR